MPEEHPGNGQGSANAFAELRSLLIGPEREELDDIHRRLDDPARILKDLSRVLPEAIRLRSKDHKLRLALHPIIEESIRVSVERDPGMLAHALYPVIGKAVRKAVASAVQGMLLSLNQVVEQSVSLRGLRWRLEAWRTGKSFGEILLLRSMLYRVEQVFLIHRKTGLLLLHAEASSVVVKDADMVSAMLTAIQDFVRDSFGASESEQLETAQVGEFSIWIQYGRLAILAGVVRGAAPRRLQQIFQDALWRISADRAADLERFDGDATPFEACRPELNECLLGQAPPGARGQSKLVWLIPVLVAVLLLGTWLFVVLRDRQRWDSYVRGLKQQPGIVVTSIEKQGSQYSISALRDPLAADSRALMAGAPRQVSFQWTPYLSSEPKFATVRGFQASREALERQGLYFATDQARITPEQLNAIGNIAAEIRDLLRQADAVGKAIHIEVLGHTDDSGEEQHNKLLGQARADQVVMALATDSVPVQRLSAQSAGIPQSSGKGTIEADRAIQRSVTFHVAGGS